MGEEVSTFYLPKSSKRLHPCWERWIECKLSEDWITSFSCIIQGKRGVPGSSGERGGPGRRVSFLCLAITVLFPIYPVVMSDLGL